MMNEERNSEDGGARPAKADRRQPLILVIDDDLEVRESTVRILEKAGFSVVTGATAAEADSLTRQHRPALVLLDVVLPDGSGVDAARTLKQDPALAGVFIIMLSGSRISPEEQAEALSKGLADGHIARPFSRAEFLARIDTYLRIRASQEALRESEKTLRKISAAVEQSPVAIVITDTTGAIEYVNPKFTETTGYTPAEVMGRNPRVLKSGEFPPSHTRRFGTPSLQAKSGGENFTTRKRMEISSGNRHPSRPSGMPREASPATLR